MDRSHALCRSVLLDRARFPHAFPTREATDVALYQSLGVPAIVQVRQVHGARVLDAAKAENEEADALVARAGQGARLAVGVRVADCVPILVADEENGDVAAIHAGWRGVVRGVIAAAFDALGPVSPLVAIGPCIGPCCFEVGEEVAREVGFVAAECGDKSFVDLRAAARAQLNALGVPDGRIEDVPGCTKHDLRFHSFRRDGAESGRMLASIAVRRSPGA